MKSLPLDVFHVGVIQIISDERISKVFHVYADLVGTTCFQAKRDKAVSVLFVDNIIMSDCRLAV